MQFKSDHPLTDHNSFGFELKTAYWACAETVEDIREALNFCREKALPIMVLGEGSNVVIAADFPGLVLRIAVPGIEIIRQDKARVWVKVGAGVNWHSLVQWSLDHDLGGLENLALIPGSVGAAPIQNIGAYGVELKTCFNSLQAVSRETGELVHFSREDCDFAYRDSVFKRELRDRYIIVHVTLCLSENPDLRMEYGEIRSQLAAMGVLVPDTRSVAQAVMQIRQRKLPDPANLGNTGSFFKNPVINRDHFAQLLQEYPDIVGYAEGDLVKVAAGWLIEQCGWKGYRIGDAGVHELQSLVLVNYGNASARQILNLANKIRSSVREAFGLDLELEPRVYGQG